MNVPWASTRAGIVYAVRARGRTRASARTTGCCARWTSSRPRGNVLNPEPPAAVSVRHNTCQRFADTLIRAMAAIWPEKAVGSSTVSFFCINVGSAAPRAPGRRGDGRRGGRRHRCAPRPPTALDGVDTYMSNVGVMPAEVVETNYSVRVLKTEFISASQGLGTHNGGLGLRREYQIIGAPQRVTFYSEQTHEDFAPRGAAGGGDAMATTVTVIGPDGAELTGLPDKASLTLQPAPSCGSRRRAAGDTATRLAGRRRRAATTSATGGCDQRRQPDRINLYYYYVLRLRCSHRMHGTVDPSPGRTPDGNRGL